MLTPFVEGCGSVRVGHDWVTKLNCGSVKSSNILVCVSLEGEPGPCLMGSSWLLLSCLCIPSLPWLATLGICPLGLRKRSWRLESVPYKQGMGNMERPCGPSSPAYFPKVGSWETLRESSEKERKLFDWLSPSAQAAVCDLLSLAFWFVTLRHVHHTGF